MFNHSNVLTDVLNSFPTFSNSKNTQQKKSLFIPKREMKGIGIMIETGNYKDECSNRDSNYNWEKRVIKRKNRLKKDRENESLSVDDINQNKNKISKPKE